MQWVVFSVKLLLGLELLHGGSPRLGVAKDLTQASFRQAGLKPGPAVPQDPLALQEWQQLKAWSQEEQRRGTVQLAAHNLPADPEQIAEDRTFC